MEINKQYFLHICLRLLKEMLTVHILLNCPFELFPISLLSLPLKKEIINREIGAHPACPHFSFFYYIMYELSLSVLVTY